MKRVGERGRDAHLFLLCFGYLLLSPRVLPYFGALLRTRVLTTSFHLAPRPRRSTGSRSLRARPWRSAASSTRAPTASTRRFARRGLASWRHARRAPRRARRSKPNSPLSIKTRTTFRGGRPAAARATRGRRSSGVTRVPAVCEVWPSAWRDTQETYPRIIARGFPLCSRRYAFGAALRFRVVPRVRFVLTAITTRVA